MSNQKKLVPSEEVRAPAQSPYLVTKDERCVKNVFMKNLDLSRK